MASAENFLTSGMMAERLSRKYGCYLPSWKVKNACTRAGLVPARLGLTRVFREADLPAVEQAMRDSGYLPAAAAAV